MLFFLLKIPAQWNSCQMVVTIMLKYKRGKKVGNLKALTKKFYGYIKLKNWTFMESLEYIDKLLLVIELFAWVLCMYLKYKANIQLTFVFSYILWHNGTHTEGNQCIYDVLAQNSL